MLGEFVMLNHLLLCMVVCLDHTSPDAGCYEKLLRRFSSGMGCLLQIDGEPFAYPQLEQVLETVDALGIEGVGIRTGHPVSKAMAEMVATHKIRSVMLRRNAIEKQSIALLRAHCVPMELSALITEDTPEQLPQMLSMCRECGIHSIVLENGVIAQYRGEQIKELPPKQKLHLMECCVQHNQSGFDVGISLSHCPNKVLIHPKWAKGDLLGGCSAGIISCAVNVDGSIIPCLPLYECVAGNIVQDDLLEVWEHAPVFQQLRTRDRLQGTCGGCEYRYACGGCRAVGFNATGDMMAPDYSCHLCAAEEWDGDG